MELSLEVAGDTLAATLTLPGLPVGGVVVLHGSNAGERAYFLYEQLAKILYEQGIAVLRYDRRKRTDGHDVPIATQAEDAVVAIGLLRAELNGGPVGIWAYSQGVWASTLVAAERPKLVDFLIAVSGSGVAPALQMRVGSARALRKQGFSEHDVAAMIGTRIKVEGYLRTGEDREAVQSELDWAATMPWFANAYLQPTLSAPGSWMDMDFDPQPVFDRVSCPVLALFGETDEWVPLEESIGAWQTARDLGALSELTIVQLRNTDHLPTFGGIEDSGAISDTYSTSVSSWTADVINRLAAAPFSERP